MYFNNIKNYIFKLKDLVYYYFNEDKFVKIQIN